MKQVVILFVLYFSTVVLFAYESEDADNLTNLRQKAEKGDVTAQSSLAIAYWKNTQPDVGASYTHFELITNNVVQMRQSNACIKCAFWATKAARSGDIVSIYLLGRLQFEKHYRGADATNGRLYLLYAALHGYTLAQEEYARVLDQALGGKGDPLEATAFLYIAGKGGYLRQEDKRRLMTIEEHLTKDQLDEVTNLTVVLRSIMQSHENATLHVPLESDDIFNESQKISKIIENWIERNSKNGIDLSGRQGNQY